MHAQEPEPPPFAYADGPVVRTLATPLLCGLLAGCIVALLAHALSDAQGHDAAARPARAESSTDAVEPSLAAPFPPLFTEAERGREVRRTAGGGAFTDLGVLVWGRVLDRTGETVVGALPTFEDRESRRTHATEGVDETFVVAGLDPGPHTIRLERNGFAPLEVQVDVPDVTSWCHDLVVERGWDVPVRFEDPDGEALRAVTPLDDPAGFLAAVATAEPPGDQLVGMTWRRANRWGVGQYLDRGSRDAALGVLEPRHHGLLRVSSPRPVWVSATWRDAVMGSRLASGIEDELVFVVDTARLDALRGEVRVRALGPDGQPIESLNLEYPGTTAGIAGELERDVLVFRDVPPGMMDLVGGSLTSGDVERVERRVYVPAGGVLDLGTLHLGAPIAFAVRVHDGRGGGLAAPVEAVRPDLVDGVTDLDQRVTTTSDASGRLELQHLGAGPVLLRAGGRDGLARVALEVVAVDGGEYELVVPNGVEVALRGPDLTSGHLVVRDRSGLPLDAYRWLPTDTCLAPGSYVLECRSATGDVTETVPFTVGRERTVVRYGS